MTTEASPDWLPTGWTLQFKFQKTGRRITHYVNLATGQKFFTKGELIQYTQTTSSQCHERQPMLGQTKMPSAKCHMNNAASANERPEWLPENWFMELKTYKSGSKIGKPYKSYVDSSTGSRFYSKPEVFQFLSQVELKSSKSKQKKRASHSTSKTAVEANKCPEWLPKNWSMELKTRQSGAKIGRNYKVYIDSSTGFRFFSKPQVFRFLNREERKSSKSKEKKQGSHSTSTVVIEKSTVDDLPAGWIKEVKIRRRANRVRRDPYYIDPATGYVFRSKRDALRYLGTGEISRHAILPQKKHVDDQNLGNNEKSQLPAAKRQKVEHPGIRGQDFTDSETSEWSVLSHLEAVTFEKGKSKKDHTQTSFTAASIPHVPQRKDSVETATRRNLRTAEKSNWSGWVAPIASKRNRGKILSADNTLVSTAAVDVLQAKNLLQSGKQKGSNIISLNSGKSKNNKELDLPRRFSRRLARLEPELVASGPELVKSFQNEPNGPCVLEDEATQQLHFGSSAEVAERTSADSTVKSQWGLVKKTIKPIEERDVLGKQPQMIKTGKTNETKSEVQHFFCSDPSFDFAIKNLAGTTPLQATAIGGLVSAPASIVQQKKNRGESRLENKSSNIETRNSSKFKKMKEFDFPHSSSEQLIRHDPERGANGVPNEVSIQNATTKSGKREQKSPCILVDKATRQLDIDRKAKLPNHDSATAVNPEINSKRRHEEGTILAEQSQVLGTQMGSDSKLEQQLFFCSDPCLEFAIKTLTGAIPLEVAMNEGLISTPVANIQQQKNLPETRIEHASCRKTLFNSTRSKKDCSLPHRASKRLAGHTTGLVANSLSSEQVCKIAGRKASINEAIPNADLTSKNLTDKASQQIETRPIMAVEHNDLTCRTSVLHFESSNKSKEHRQNQTVPTEMNIEKPGLHHAIPCRNSWPDPRFEFAFKTVTGSAAEESFAFQSYFNQQFGSSGSQSDGNSAMPYYGLPNVFQSEISSHVGATAQPVVQVQHQFPVDPSSLPHGNGSIPSCSRVGAQQPYRKKNKELRGKVKS